MMEALRLYTYFRSGAAHRVRIALALKGLSAEHIPVHLARGEQHSPAYLAINPQGRAPTLMLPDGTALIQSPAIIEYLEEAYPAPPLLPVHAIDRARVRGIAALIGCDIHPLNNLSVLATLRRMDQDEAAISAWIAHWITLGFAAVETLIGDADWCFGEHPGLADIYLIPQVFSARRFGVEVGAFPRIGRVAALGDAHPAFVAAAPARQADAEGSK